MPPDAVISRASLDRAGVERGLFEPCGRSLQEPMLVVQMLTVRRAALLAGVNDRCAR